MRLVSLAALLLLLRVVPLVTAKEAEAEYRSCKYDGLLRKLRLDQEQSIPFCRNFLTTVIIVSVTVTITDSTITTETIRPTYTELLTKTKTATIFTAPPDDHALVKRILAARDEPDGYYSSLVSEYSPSALSSACSCLCIESIVLGETDTTTTQTIPETIVDISTETVDGPSTTVQVTTTTTTTRVELGTPFPAAEFRFAFFSGDETNYEKKYLGFSISESDSRVLEPVDASSQRTAICRIDVEGNLSCRCDDEPGEEFFAWVSGINYNPEYPGSPLPEWAPHEVSFSPIDSDYPPSAYFTTWGADQATFSFTEVTDLRFNVMQLCPSSHGPQTWVIWTQLVTNPSCTQIHLAVEPIDFDTFAALIYYWDAEGNKQYLSFEDSASGPETGSVFMTSRPTSSSSALFMYSYRRLAFVKPPDYYEFLYPYFIDDMFQGGNGWAPAAFNSPSFVKFFNDDYATTYYEWEIDWEAYTIHPVVSGVDTLITQICLSDGDGTTILAIGTYVLNDDGYTCTAVILELETTPFQPPTQDFLIFSMDYSGEGYGQYEQFLCPLYYEDPVPGLDIDFANMRMGSPTTLDECLFSFDAGGHLMFYSSHYSDTLYALSFNYPSPRDYEWHGYVDFISAANFDDASCYLQFRPEYLTLSGSRITDLHVKSWLSFGIGPGRTEDSYPVWAVGTSEVADEFFVSIWEIRPKSWPVRISWINSEGTKQYLKFTNPAYPDEYEGSFLAATSDVTESATFTLDSQKHFWYHLDWPGGPVRLSSMIDSVGFRLYYPTPLRFDSRPGIASRNYVKWSYANRNGALTIVPVVQGWGLTSIAWQLCTEEYFGIQTYVLAVYTTVYESDEEDVYNCVGIDLMFEWQMESGLHTT